MTITRHAEARLLLADGRLSSDMSASLEAFALALEVDLSAFLAAARATVAFVDGRDHAALRRITTAMTTCGTSWDDAIRGATARTLASLRDRRSADGVTELAAPIATHLLEVLCGVPPEHVAAVNGWLEDVTALIAGELGDAPPDIAAGLRAANAAVEELVRWFTEWAPHAPIAEVSRWADHLQPPLPRVTQLIAVAQSVRVTLADQLAMALHALLEHPAAAARFASEPALRPLGVEELLRFAPTDRRATRVALEPLEVCGTWYSAGDEVLVSLADANRDPSVFGRPDELILERSPNPHLSFGGGTHACPAARPARRALVEVLGGFFDAFPDAQLECTGEVRWRRGPVLHRLARLPLSLSR